MNLQLYILKEVIYGQSSFKAGSRGVALSDCRKSLRVPNSTFYRAVSGLIESGIITKVSRDRYSISMDVIDHCAVIKWDMKNE